MKETKGRTAFADFFFVEMNYILFEVGADHLYQNLIKFCFRMVKYRDVILS